MKFVWIFSTHNQIFENSKNLTKNAKKSKIIPSNFLSSCATKLNLAFLLIFLCHISIKINAEVLDSVPFAF